MGVFNIISEESTVQIYCFKGHWDGNDTVHSCPVPCGQINYIDVYGNPQTKSGISAQSGVISIEAQSIVSTVGVEEAACSGTSRSLLAGNMTCGNGQIHFTGSSITLYSLSHGSNIIDGDRLFTDSAMTTPYSPTTEWFIKDTNNNYIYSVDINGYITYEGYQGGPC